MRRRAALIVTSASAAYWKVDDQGSIVWTHGYVRWQSL
jgi:hypothetical protein